MIAWAKKIDPCSAKIRKGGEWTEFSIPQSHKGVDGKWYRDGFINIVAKGLYDFREGDSIIVKASDTTGAARKEYNGIAYMYIYVNTVEIIKC